MIHRSAQRSNWLCDHATIAVGVSSCFIPLADESSCVVSAPGQQLHAFGCTREHGHIGCTCCTAIGHRVAFVGMYFPLTVATLNGKPLRATSGQLREAQIYCMSDGSQTLEPAPQPFGTQGNTRRKARSIIRTKGQGHKRRESLRFKAPENGAAKAALTRDKIRLRQS